MYCIIPKELIKDRTIVPNLSYQYNQNTGQFNVGHSKDKTLGRNK